MIKHLLMPVSAILVFSSVTIAQAPGLPVKREAVLRTGMSLPDAMIVAINCTREASGYKTISDRRKIKLYRPEDKLSDLGITSADRLNTLRRYLVRNEEIGVQSVFDLDTPTETAYQPRRYIIPRDKLVELSSGWTLLKLAQTIQKESGVPRMPFSTAAEIVSDCRQYSDNSDPIAPPDPKPTSTPTSASVKNDPKLPAARIFDFVKCIVASEKYGVSTAHMETPDDEPVAYFLNNQGATNQGATKKREPIAKDQVDETIIYIKDGIENKDWNYYCLIEFIAQNAQIMMPVESVAAGIVISNILKQTEALGKKAKFTEKMKLVEIKDVGGKPIALNLQDLRTQINHDIDSQSLILPFGCTANQPLKKKRALAVLPPIEKSRSSYTKGAALPADSQNTVEELIGAVEILIQQ